MTESERPDSPPGEGLEQLAGLDRIGLRLAQAAGWLCADCGYRRNLKHSRSPLKATREVAAHLLAISGQMAEEMGLSLHQAYIEKLRLEESSLVAEGAENAVSEQLEKATAWRQFQIGQIAYDRRFYPDIVGQIHSEQLTIHGLYLAELLGAWALAVEQGRLDDFYSQNLADVAICGVRLATLGEFELADSPVDEVFDPLSAGIID